MSRTEELEAELRADWSDAALSVYADHLQAIGDPRGELIALDLEGADGEGVAARRGRLLRRWLGVDPLLQFWWEPTERRWLAGNQKQGLWLLVEYGLIELVQNRSTQEATALVRFLASDASQFLHRMSISADQRTLRGAIANLTARPRPWMRALAIRRGRERGTLLPDPTGLATALPHLVHLELEGQDLIEELDHAGVAELVLTGPAMSLSRGQPLASVATLDVASDHRPFDLADIQPQRLPNLKRLVLSREAGNDPLPLDRLADLPIANQLTYLELPALRSSLQVDQVQRAADRMPQLRELVIAHAYMCFGDCRVVLARARVRHAEPWPWRPLDQLPQQSVRVERDWLAPIAELIEALELSYFELPAAARTTWFRLWSELDTSNLHRVNARDLADAIDALGLTEHAWSNLASLLHGRNGDVYVGLA